MKKKLGILLKVIAFLALLAVVLLAVMTLTERKASYIKNKDFFEEAKKDHIDVLFLGSSHVINGINPMTLYSDYGITSYNLGGHGSLLQETYWQLIRALEYTKPDYVVVDCYMMEKNYQYLDVCEEDTSDEDIEASINKLHLNMDAYPLSKLKIAAVNDLIQDQDIRNQFLFDFIVYHSRWSELNKDDFGRFNGKTATNKLMGAEMVYGVKPDVDVYPPCQEGEVLPEHTVGKEYLMKIIDECQRDGIGVILVYIPFSAQTIDQIAANTAGQVAETYGVPYLNMLEVPGIIDEASDLNDHGHLNVVGADKVTAYIGQYLSENADLTDHREDPEYENWEKLSKKYKKSVKNAALDGEELRSELNLLSAGGYNSIIYVNNNSPALEDEGVRHLISNISGTSRIDETAGNGQPYILINDKNGVYEAVGGEVLENVNTCLGELTYIPVEEKFRLLYPSSDENTNYLYDDSHTEDIQILIYDNKGEVLSHLYYDSLLREYLKTQ